MANPSFAVWNSYGDFFSLSIFDLWLVKSMDEEPIDMEGQLYNNIFCI